MSSTNWEYWVDNEKMEVWLHIPSGFPTVLGASQWSKKRFPRHQLSLCSKKTIDALKNADKKTYKKWLP